MKRTLATACTVVLLALSVAGCGDKDSGAKAGGGTQDTSSDASPSESASDTPTESTGGLPTEIPSDCLSALPTAVPTDGTIPSLPAECVPSGLPTEVPTDAPSQVPAGAGVDACALVTQQLLTADLGMATGGQLIGQPSSFGDPASKDCYYAAQSGDLIAVKATSRAATDMPESSYGTGSLPGAEKIDGVDWGYIYLLSPSPTVASVTFVKGDVGLDMSITTSKDTTIDQFKKFAADLVAELG